MSRKLTSLLLAILLLVGCTSAMAEAPSHLDALIVGVSDGAADALILAHAAGSEVRLLMVDPELLPVERAQDVSQIAADVGEIYGMDLSRYVGISFDELADVVDALGGIELTVTDEDLAVRKEDGEVAFSAAGAQLVTGDQARALLGTGTEQQLSERRIRVFEAMLNLARTGELSLSGDLVERVMALCETNFTLEDMVTMGMAMLSGENLSIETKRAPLTDDITSDAEAAATREYLN